MKDSKTGGRLIRLLASHGYVQVDHTKKPPFPVLLLTKLTRDRITANNFLTWRARNRFGWWFNAVDTDLVDLNEKLVAHGFPPLRFITITSMRDELKAKDLYDNFGRKVELR